MRVRKQEDPKKKKKNKRFKSPLGSTYDYASGNVASKVSEKMDNWEQNKSLIERYKKNPVSIPSDIFYRTATAKQIESKINELETALGNALGVESQPIKVGASVKSIESALSKLRKSIKAEG